MSIASPVAESGSPVRKGGEDVTQKEIQYYLNKRIDSLEETMKENHNEIKDLIGEHLKNCNESKKGFNCRMTNVENFKIRVYQSVSLVLGALGVYKVFF